MGRKINKKILEDFNSTYESKLTPQDIISKTNYFNEPVDENYYSYKKFKLKLKYTYSCFLVLIICVTVSVFGMFVYSKLHRNDYIPEIENVTYELNDEESSFVYNYVSTYAFRECTLIKNFNSSCLTIFRGISLDDPNQFIYFYKIFSEDKVNLNYILEINNQVINITNENSIGILTTTSINDELYDVLSFNLINNDVSSSYTISVPKD